MNSKVNPKQFINRIAKQIGEKFRPQKVILFGSHAFGRASDESDIDLMVVFAQNRNLRKRYVEISKEIGERPFPVDLLVRSSKQIQKRRKMGDSFIEEVLTKGKIIYES